MPDLTRRVAMSGALFALGGCSTLSALSSASEVLDTYDLTPASGSKQGRRTARTLLVARPQATAVLTTDRILVKPDPATVTYLPDARWGDELPAVVQSLLIRSISETGRIGYVGRSDAGPVPDKAMLVRIDAFEVQEVPAGGYLVAVDMDLTILNDRDQTVVASRRFQDTARIPDDQPATIVGAFQAILDAVLPAIADWAVARV